MSFLDDHLGANVERSFKNRYGTTPEKEKNHKGNKRKNNKKKHGKDLT